MSNIIDISARITNQLPVVKITDEIIVTVNNRKSTIMSMQLLSKEQERKAKERSDENDGKEEFDELSFMSKILSMLIGQKNVDAIEKLDLPLPEYKIIYQCIMAAATGQSQEEVEKRFQ